MTRIEEQAGLAELEQRARGGDQAARDELLNGLSEALVPFCFRYLGGLEEAEDAAQDVLVKLTAGETWPTGSLRAWVFRVARNLCADLARRRQDGRFGAGATGASSLFLSPATGPGTAVAREDEREYLRLHVATLSPPHAEVLMLRFFDGLARKEIAEVLELTESCVKARLSEAVEELRRRTRGLR